MKRLALLAVLAVSCITYYGPFAYVETRPGPTYDDCRQVFDGGVGYAECVTAYTETDFLFIPLEDGGYQEVQLETRKVDGGLTP